MSSKNPLVTTTDKNSKERINDMETKSNVVEEDITHPIATNKIDTSNEIDKPQASKIKKYINPSAMNQTKVDHWINQGRWINRGLLK